MLIYKIYSLKDPNTSKVMYVGCTTAKLNARLSQHLYDAKNKSYKKNQWILDLLAQNLKPIVEELEIVTEETWKVRERYWISYFESPLNFDRGGGGIVLDRTPESIARSSTAKFVPIYQYTLNGEFIKNWESISSAEAELGILNTNLGNSLSGRSRTAGGFRWSYEKQNALPDLNYSKNPHMTKQKVYQYDTNLNLLNVFSNLTEATTILNIPRNTIFNNLKGKNDFIKRGYKFSYDELRSEEISTSTTMDKNMDK